MSITALLFPGQGSQEVGMSRELAENNTEIMNLWKKAEKTCNIALREIYWEGDEAAMAQTRNLQPALTTANIACWTALSSKIQPCCVAGHSLGELSAFAAAQVLPFDDIIALATLRGQLMSSADPDGVGAMAAIVKVDLATVEECVKKAQAQTKELLVIANYNTPGQYVVSGTKASIAAITEEVKIVKGRAIPLAVSGAFHSPLMKDAAKEFAAALNALDKGKWNNAAFPVYCNTIAQGLTDRDAVRKQLSLQMTSSVFWIDTIRNQWESGARRFIECGPKQVLSKMVAPILKGEISEDTTPEALAVNTLETLATV